MRGRGGWKKKGKKFWRKSSSHPLRLVPLSFLEVAQEPTVHREAQLPGRWGRRLSVRYRTSSFCEDGGELCFGFLRNSGRRLQRPGGGSGVGKTHLPSLHPPLPTSRLPNDSLVLALGGLALASAKQLMQRRPRLQDWPSARERKKEEMWKKKTKQLWGGFSFLKKKN